MSDPISKFRVVRREPGRTTTDIPIFTATPEAAAQLLDDRQDEHHQCIAKPYQQNCINNKPYVEDFRDGVFVIHNVLTPQECQRILDLSETMGYIEDAPVSLGRDIRRNESCVWIMDKEVNQIIFQRAKEFLPRNIELDEQVLSEPIGLNQRYRFYKYNPKDVFKMHTDGAWTWSGLDEDGNYVDDIYHGTAESLLTFLIYLNDNFEGGATRFPVENPGVGEPKSFDVTPRQGSVLVFYHGFHELSRLHEGTFIESGTKYVARTDVMYVLPPGLQEESPWKMI